MYSGKYLRVPPRTALNEKWAKSAQHRLIDGNETRLF
jgi:hypothetical protein